MIYLRKRHAKEVDGKWVGMPLEYYLSSYPLNKRWNVPGYEKTNPGFCSKCYKLREDLIALNNKRIAEGRPSWKNLSEIFQIECFDIPILSIDEEKNETVDYRNTIATSIIANMTSFPDVTKEIVWTKSWAQIKKDIAVKEEYDEDGGLISRSYPEYIIPINLTT